MYVLTYRDRGKLHKEQSAVLLPLIRHIENVRPVVWTVRDTNPPIDLTLQVRTELALRAQRRGEQIGEQLSMPEPKSAPKPGPYFWQNNGLRAAFFKDWTHWCDFYAVPDANRGKLFPDYMRKLTGKPTIESWLNPGGATTLIDELKVMLKADYPKAEDEKSLAETPPNQPPQQAEKTPPATSQPETSATAVVAAGSAEKPVDSALETKAIALTTTVDTSTGEIIAFDPTRALNTTKAKSALLSRLVEDQVLIKGVDFGEIPGTDKPTLLKPGAEKLLSAFQLFDKFTEMSVERNWKNGFFFYEYECTLYDRETGKAVGSGIGSCNTLEKKYRYRWVTADRVPATLDKATLPSRGGKISEFAFAVEKAETTGQYGKPAAYWQAFADAQANGKATLTKRLTSKGKEMDAIEVDSTMYGIPNEDIFDLVNTISKMAQKRALVAAVLNATGASARFTQDLEDLSLNDFGMIDRVA